MRRAEKKRLEYRFVRHDISSNCNQRCRFCVHDWSARRASINMSPETFSRIVPLIPLIRDEGFFFSCRFEPLINPRLIDLLSLLPASCARKGFLTTNLSLPMPDALIDKLSKSPLHHINISIQTFNPDVHKRICRGSNFDVFQDNLRKLDRCFRASSSPPLIRFITMILKDNFEEIIELAARCHDEFAADSHEFRTPYRYSLAVLDQPWIEQQLLPRKELNSLAARLQALPFRTTWSMESDEQELLQGRASYKERVESGEYDIYAVRDIPYSDEELAARSRLENFYDLRIEADGAVYFYGTGERYDIHSVRDSLKFFEEQLIRLSEIASERCMPVDEPASFFECSDRVKLNIDSYVDQGAFLELVGWAFVENRECEDLSRFVLVKSGAEQLSYPIEAMARPDVADHFGNQQYLYSGFRCLIRKRDLPENSLKVGIVFKSSKAEIGVEPLLYGECLEDLCY